MYTLDSDVKRQIIHLLVEGNSIRSCERLTNVHRDTIMRLLVRTGDACRDFLDSRLRNMKLRHLQCDEIWTFVGKKQAMVRVSEYDGHIGDQYLWVAFDTDTKLMEHVAAYLSGKMPDGSSSVTLEDIFNKRVLVPTYYDKRYSEKFNAMLEDNGLEPISIGELLDAGAISVRGGHGSPGNDQRSGHIPYVKVSDIRGLRMNINPTNLVTESVARRFWRGPNSGLKAWDVLTPNRASSNIGEFAIVLPGEEQVVVTKEVFIFRVLDDKAIDAFYLLWALSLKTVRDQWRRIALMQTNREDCGSRYREILIPKPKSKAWSIEASSAFRTYFTTIANAKTKFIDSVRAGDFAYVANVFATVPTSDGMPEDVDSKSVGKGDNATN